MKKIGILGYGYTVNFLAQLLVGEGYKEWGISRDTTSLQYELSPGAEIIDFHLGDISKSMLNISFLLVSTPPTDFGLDPSLSPMAKEFYESYRCVSNAKLKHTILPNLIYSSYKEGLNAILLGENLA